MSEINKTIFNGEQVDLHFLDFATASSYLQLFL
jgi:hypothetical protein